VHEIQDAYLRRLADAGESREWEGVLAVRTGVRSNTENGAVSTVPGLPEELVAEVLDWLGGVPASWVALDPRLGPSLLAAGCTPENDGWNMRRQIGELEPPAIEVKTVASAAELDEWLAIARECGWFDDGEPARRLYEALGYEGLYLAEDGAASAFFAPPTVLLNTVAVRPRRQRRGIGRALALARLRDGRERGCTEALLAPSPAGRKLYDSLGFRLEPQPPGYWFYLPAER
jgi:GNAT superfamily N-acetyltransferase